MAPSWNRLLIQVLSGLAVFCLLIPLGAIDSGNQSDNPPLSLLVNTAQNDAINCLIGDSTHDLLFSASEDGSINIYSNGKNLVQHLQVSSDPLINMAVSNDGKLAILEKSSVHHYRLSVWDWKTGTQIWNAALSDQALSMAFSPRGNYLVLTLARWNSFLFIEANTGKIQPWLQEGFGIVDYALVSSKEERVLSYHSTSGSLSYFELATGTELKKVQTQANLRQFMVVPDPTRTRAIAIDANKLVTIDLLNGKILDTKDPGFSPTQLLCNEQNPNRIVVLGGTATAIRRQAYGLDLTTGTLVPLESDKIAFKNGMSSACLLQGQLYLGDRTGLVQLVLSKDTFKPLAEHQIAEIIGIGFGNGILYLSTTAGFIRIQTELVAAQSNAPLMLTLPKSRIMTGVPANCGLTNLSDRELLLWDKNKTPRLYRYDLKQDAIVRSSGPGTNSLIRVIPWGDQCLVVDAGGQIRKLEVSEFRTQFSLNTLGALSADSFSKGELLIGKGASGKLDSPLLRINEKTGETVSIDSQDSAIFLTRASPKSKPLFMLAINQSGGKPMTLLEKILPDQIPLRSETVMSFSGEDLGADIALSPTGTTVYTSAGRAVVSAWDNQTSWSLEETTRVPRELRTWGNLVFSINQDGSLSVWNAESRKFLLDLFVLNTGNIFFLTRSAAYGIVARNIQEENRDRKMIENLLSVPALLQEKGNPTILPVQYPVQLP